MRKQLSKQEHFMPIQGRLRFAHSDWPGYSSFDEAFMPGPRAGAWGGMTGGSGVIW
jgi:hypothetical protein